MLRGIDTTFLVEVELREHPGHAGARALRARLLAAGDVLALAPQVVVEFAHVVTDPRRFAQPLSMDAALARGSAWWNAAEVTHALPSDDALRLLHSWMGEHGLGRKHLLDTFLAATYWSIGVRSIVSTNARDFARFGCFEVLMPSG